MASSVRPAPISPLIPTTSPRRTLRLTLSQTFRPLYSGWYTVQFFISSVISPILLTRLGNRSVISRPTMPRMMRGSLISSLPLTRVSIVAPSRRIVMLSATCSTSPSLWEISIEVSPSDFNLSISLSRFCESSSLSEAVGSSKISRRTFFARAFAISTSCCLPTPMSLINVCEDS